MQHYLHIDYIHVKPIDFAKRFSEKIILMIDPDASIHVNMATLWLNFLWLDIYGSVKRHVRLWTRSHGRGRILARICAAKKRLGPFMSMFKGLEWMLRCGQGVKR